MFSELWAKMNLLSKTAVGFGFVLVCGVVAYAGFNRGGSPQADLDALQKMGVRTTWDAMRADGPKGKPDAEPYYEKFDWLYQPTDKTFMAAYYALDARSHAYQNPVDLERDANRMRAVYEPVLAGADMPQWNMNLPEEKKNCRESMLNAALNPPVNMAFADGLTGNLGLAIRELEAEEKLRSQIDANPYWSGWFEDDILNTYLEILVANREDPRSVAQIKESLLAVRPPHDMRFTFERYLGYDCDIYHDPERIMAKLVNPSFFDRFDHEWIEPRRVKSYAMRDIHMWRVVFEKLPAGDVGWLTGARAIDSVSHDLNGRNNRYQAYYSQLAYAHERCEWAGSNEAFRRVLISSCNVLLERWKTGKIPSQLPGSGDDSIDPFNRKPLIYRQTPYSFTVYSIGANRKDDGGMPGKTWSDGDIAASFKL